MTSIPVWRLFAFMADDETGVSDEVRILADWQLQDTLRWCTARGYDHIYFSRTPDTTRFEKQPPPDEITHESNIVPLPRSTSGVDEGTAA